MKFKTVSRGVLVALSLGLASTSAMATKLVIIVSKVSQHMTITIDGVKQYDWLVSTGGPGYDTPTGTYHPFRMEKEHFSQEWDNAPMPNSMFFTGQGHAIHGSYHIARLGTRASHGCVRLAPENAAKLYALMTDAGFKNTTITINGGFFDFGSQTAAASQPYKPFHFFWEARVPAAKPVNAIVKKKKFKSIFASNG